MKTVIISFITGVLLAFFGLIFFVGISKVDHAMRWSEGFEFVFGAVLVLFGSGGFLSTVVMAIKKLHEDSGINKFLWEPNTTRALKKFGPSGLQLRRILLDMFNEARIEANTAKAKFDPFFVKLTYFERVLERIAGMFGMERTVERLKMSRYSPPLWRQRLWHKPPLDNGSLMTAQMYAAGTKSISLDEQEKRLVETWDDYRTHAVQLVKDNKMTVREVKGDDWIYHSWLEMWACVEEWDRGLTNMNSVCSMLNDWTSGYYWPLRYWMWDESEKMWDIIVGAEREARVELRKQELWMNGEMSETEAGAKAEEEAPPLLEVYNQLQSLQGRGIRYLEYTRGYNRHYRRDWLVVIDFIEDFEWRKAAIKHFGAKDEKVRELFEQIRIEQGEKEYNMVREMFLSFVGAKKRLEGLLSDDYIEETMDGKYQRNRQTIKTVRDFIVDRCTLGVSVRAEYDELYAAYIAYCKKKGLNSVYHSFFIDEAYRFIDEVYRSQKKMGYRQNGYVVPYKGHSESWSDRKVYILGVGIKKN